jgi:non-ribosomal peptide synthetase component F
MRSHLEYFDVRKLVARGLNDCQIARTTGIPRTTIRDWRRGRTASRRTNARAECGRCRHPAHDYRELPQTEYAYLLGMYLGDGGISRHARAWRLRITLDMKWPGIISSCEVAMKAVFPNNQVGCLRPDRRAQYVVLSVYSEQIVCLFPQHGDGPKHLRRIQLADWQNQIVRQQPEGFLRGLIHSDGCRFINQVHAKGKTYEYPRYNFTNASEDIRRMFTSTCDQLNVEWRQMNRRNISVARRSSVAQLDEFIGPKA